MRVLITSGGTKIPIDKVRSITNMSKGTFGSQIAEAFLESLAAMDYVDFIYAKGSKRPGYKTLGFIDYHEYETFWEYENKLMKCLEKKPDIIILAAAVSDYEVVNPVEGKIRTKDDMIIKLKSLPKLIGLVKEKCPDSILCGFKLLVNSTKEELIAAANKSIELNGCDLVIANDLSTIKDTKNHSMIVVKNNWSKEFFRDDYNLPNVVRHFCMTEYLQK